MLRRRKTLPMGKKKAHANVAMTAWAIRTWCSSRKAGDEVSNCPECELAPGRELPEEEPEPEPETRKFPPPPANCGEAIADDRKKMTTREDRIECILCRSSKWFNF